ncbi:efflux RND transporter periplasmic adaptor subunit [Cetobacterium ceti]
MKQKIVIGIVALLLIGGGYKIAQSLGGKPIKVEKIQMGNGEVSSLYGGIVAPGDVVPVYIEAPALIESISAREGQIVKPGDKLMTFSQKSVIENDRELRANELDLKDTELRIADLNSGSLKLELDNRLLEIKNLEEKIRGYNRKLPVLGEEVKTFKSKAKAYMELLAKDGVSTTEANRAMTDANKKEVELEDLRTELELARQKYELMVVSYESLKRELNINEAQLKSQYEKLKLTNEILTRREEQLKKPLEAPIAGVITKIDVTEGSLTQGGQRLLAIGPEGESIVRVEIPLYQASSIKIGDGARVISRDMDGDKTYSGVVTSVSSVAQESYLNPGKDNKVVMAEVKIEGKNSLNPGFQTDVEIAGKKRDSIPLVNAFSVLDENGKHYVYLIENGKAIKTPVKIGMKTVSAYEILDLPVGSEIALNPFKVRDGERVKVVK